MLARLWIALVLFFCAALPAAAEEYIRTYHSEIAVAEDGMLTVAETISVNAEGNRIKRGIFRDFPLTMRDADGRMVKVGFELLSVTRDGQPEAYHTERVTGGIRIYTGSEDVFLDRGQHTYVLTYRSDRQIRFFPDHDELYWNVTGNGWQFRIATASARVTLPEGADVTQTAAFTGPLGSEAKNARMQDNGNTAVFATTRPLGEQEGLTVVVGIPKGVITPPSATQEKSWWLRDNMDALIGFGGLGIVLLYYVWFWRKVGRDPARGVVVPRWDAPEGLSPALVNYIDNKGFSGGGWTAFSASALDLAVKGYLVLEDLKSSITLKRTATAGGRGDGKPMPTGQATILKYVDDSGGTLIIDKENGEKVQAAGSAFRQSIEKEHRGKYYKSNIGYILGGVFLSIVALVALIGFSDMEPDLLALLIVPVFLSVFFGLFAMKFGRGLRSGSSVGAKIVSVIILGIFGVVALSIISTVVVSLISELDGGDHWPVYVSVGGIVLANLIFFFLMGAPTPLGRKLMDGIEGLKTYLTLAEKDRMNMAGVPTMSPQHFEKLLPYAVALGVEKPWSRTFEAWLATAAAGAAAAAYAPGWYSGSSYSNFGDRIGGFSSSMASTIASTIPAPQSSSSSSGFSGGSSGGGGGGGGGGGW
ncbi:DUF2207 domain-containing protein [Neorhizobium alkalisoli]|uniref:Putative membrane protein DUF2207 n=1 Tax=Neorhizobium alkalisoli TaxID=528178 RepID=A0A561R3S0_9HYPH|nr:DUF2207 domain-containing protein [Neorhizobium alkalisoli]TWF57275.1 putative membrane protein DUF2207 [Neorhizobium alkalisoli]